MSAAPMEHASFTIERHLYAPPPLVCEAWSTPQARARWFTGSQGEWNQDLREMDFRVGGRALSGLGPRSGLARSAGALGGVAARG